MSMMSNKSENIETKRTVTNFKDPALKKEKLGKLINETYKVAGEVFEVFLPHLSIGSKCYKHCFLTKDLPLHERVCLFVFGTYLLTLNKGLEKKRFKGLKPFDRLHPERRNAFKYKVKIVNRLAGKNEKKRQKLSFLMENVEDGRYALREYCNHALNMHNILKIDEKTGEKIENLKQMKIKQMQHECLQLLKNQVNKVNSETVTKTSLIANKYISSLSLNSLNIKSRQKLYKENSDF
ncbi:MAG: hypothetical protein AMS24_02335 [Chlamydiae bacterium SM23_39]|nr:MAG: hypothetical protein AMS24_02335 [Chlamydiae bacterium SM23_39]